MCVRGCLCGRHGALVSGLGARTASRAFCSQVLYCACLFVCLCACLYVCGCCVADMVQDERDRSMASVRAQPLELSVVRYCIVFVCLFVCARVCMCVGVVARRARSVHDLSARTAPRAFRC